MASPDPTDGAAGASLLDELERLETLPHLEPEELDRLLFLFRASDPGVYQPAAAALGRRAVSDDAADRALYEYARMRRIDAERPLQLNGQRSTRRVLLARTSTWVHAPGDLRGPPPVTPEQVSAGRPDNAADAAVLLDVVAQLLATRAVEGLAEAAETLLNDLPDHRAGRMVWRRWTEMLFAIRAHGLPMQVPGCTGAWRDALHHLVITGHGEAPVADGTRRLIALDELFRIAGQHPDALQELSSAWPHTVTEADRRWCRLRFATWCRRHHPGRAALLNVEPRDYAGLARRAAELERAWQERPGHIGASPVETQEQGLLDTLAGLVADRERWRRQPARERALALFLIVDLDTAMTVEPKRAAAFPGIDRGGSGLTVPWVLRVAEWETIAPETLLDARTLHGIRDIALQERLVRRDATGAGELADVFEHRFRELLHHPRQWDPRRFLLRLHGRQPAPALFRRMRSVVSDREYVDPAGEAVPLAQWCRALADEDESTRRPGLDSVDGHRAPVLEGLHALAGEPGVPAEAVRDLIALLGKAGTTVGAPPGNVIGLLRYLGPPAGARQLPEHELDAIQHELLNLAELLGAGGWKEPLRTREAAAGLDHQLDRLEQTIGPLLPYPEAAALQAACSAIRRYTRAWLQGLEAVAAAAAEPGDDDPQHWSAALARVPAELPTPLRGPLLLEVWNSLRTTTDQPVALLRWATGRLDEQSLPAVVDALAEYWRDLLRTAMTTGATADVRMLVKDPVFTPLRERIRDPELGHVLRTWHFDRLRPLTGITAGRRLGGPANPFRGFGAFLGNFTAVWIGLLVGAILMLDFGNAWRTMAEDGDLPGIAVTFLLGAGGTAAYVLANLRTKVRRTAGEAAPGFWLGELGRVLAFLVLCLAYTLAATGGLWLLLSGTGEVVHGPMAAGHIVVWAGFALFAGTFFGLVAKEV